MAERKLTCIICPRGCELTVTLGEGGVEAVAGNGCRRGIDYAKAECTHPMRTVTSTVRCKDGSVVAVKTASAVPKEKVFAVMEAINSIVAESDVIPGTVLARDLLGTGADLVVTGEKSN